MESSFLQNRSSGLPGRPTADANLADILERVLDKGIVIAGDIQINLLDIELLTIKLRLLIASVDKAKEMGINWWESDPSLTRGEDGGPPYLVRFDDGAESLIFPGPDCEPEHQGDAAEA